MKRPKPFYIFVSVDPRTGDESVVATQKGKVYMPLICTGWPIPKEMVESARKAAEITGFTVRLIKLSRRELIETFVGSGFQ